MDWHKGERIMPIGAPHVDPLFSIQSAGSLSRDHIIAVAAGQSAATLITGFLEKEVCEDVVSNIDSTLLDPYDPARVFPPIARFGPVLNDYRHNGTLASEYWEHVARARKTWGSVNFQVDPVDVCRERLAAAWRGRVKAASRRNQELFAGTIREINQGAQVHYDEVLREFHAGLMDEVVVIQLAFNAYLSVPETGGDTIVWRRRWQPADETARKGYGYDDAIVQGVQNVRVRPNLGDALLFDPRNYHSVTEGIGSRRIALAFFIGLTAAGDLLLWS